jgi:hypothetical protein
MAPLLELLPLADGVVVLPLVDGVLVLEPADEPVLPVLEPEVPPEVCAMARPMARVALRAIRVFFIREISFGDMTVGSRGHPALQSTRAEGPRL